FYESGDVVPMQSKCPSGCVTSFFFQAEDGIRDKLVTGVQTCALPISDPRGCSESWKRYLLREADVTHGRRRRRWLVRHRKPDARSEERRVGKESRGRGTIDRKKKKVRRDNRGGTMRDAARCHGQGREL